MRIRWSLTGYGVPSCWAHSETRYSSSIQRTCRSRSPGGRPSGQRVDLVQVGLLQVGDPVHQLPVAVDRAAALVEPRAPLVERARGRSGSGRSWAAPGLADEAAVHQPARAGAFMSVSAGSMRHVGAAAEQPARRARHAVEHPDHVGAARRAAAPRRSRPPRPRSASYAASSRTGAAGVDGRAARTAARQSSSSSATEGYGDPASAELLGVGRATVEHASTGDGERQQQQPAHAEPVPGVALLLGAEDPQPDGRALVDQRRGSRAPRGRRGSG